MRGWGKTLTRRRRGGRGHCCPCSPAAWRRACMDGINEPRRRSIKAPFPAAMQDVREEEGGGAERRVLCGTLSLAGFGSSHVCVHDENDARRHTTAAPTAAEVHADAHASVHRQAKSAVQTVKKLRHTPHAQQGSMAWARHTPAASCRGQAADWVRSNRPTHTDLTTEPMDRCMAHGVLHAY